MKRNAKLVVTILLIATLCAASLLTLSGCSILILASRIGNKSAEIVVNGAHIWVVPSNDNAVLMYFDADTTLEKGELQTCEVPESVSYRRKEYPVTQIGYNSYGQTAIINGDAQIGELVVPSSVTYINLDYFSDIDTLEAITVSGGNSNYYSKDGVLYKINGDYSSRSYLDLEYYPLGKKDATVELPRAFRSILYNSHIWENENLQNLEIEYGGNFTSINGALYSKDGETLMLYPVHNTNSAFVAPKGMKNIDLQSCFWENDNVKIVEVEEDSQYLKVEDNVLYSKDGSELIFRPNDGREYFAIPSTVRVVSYNALMGLQYLYVPKEVVVFLDVFTCSNFSLSQISHVYFESETLPKYLRDVEFTEQQIRFGYTRERFDELINNL